MKDNWIILATATLLVLGGFWLYSPQSPMEKFTSSQEKEIEQIIHQYLVSKPEVLIEASQVLQQRTKEQQMEQTKTAVDANRSDLFSSDSPTLGNPNGEIVLIKFLDYQCGHCKKMEAVVEGLIGENPSLKVIIKELPVSGGESTFAAKAALAAKKQDKFAIFHKALLEQKEKLSEESILALAEENGLDLEKLKADIELPVINEQLDSVNALAQQLAIRGTPYFIIMNNSNDGKAMIFPGAGSQTQLQQLINELKN